jgi:hypothetical protein
MRTIAFHREFVTVTGNVTSALLLSQICYWSKRTTKPGGWFYKSSSDWMAETGLTRHELISARRRLVDRNIVSEMRRGIPATVNFRLNADILNELLAAHCPEIGQPVIRKPDILLAGNQSSNPEMTTEMTQKKERRGRSLQTARVEIYSPKIKYPETEREMEFMLEECGAEYCPDYDGNFFYTMRKNGWCIRGEPIYDWVATYKARVEHATEPF